jgi:hypothetical protein
MILFFALSISSWSLCDVHTASGQVAGTKPHPALPHAVTTAPVTSENAPTVAATTDVPRTMSYQGYLSNDGRAVHDGQYPITVKLYSDPDGINAIYDATYQTPVVNGMFNILLGSGQNPLPSGDMMNMPLWIGITVNGHEELKPYTPLSASPYALNVPNNAITTDKLSDGAVTTRKIGTDFVGSLWIDGDKVSGHGSKINLEGTGGIGISFDITRNTIVFSGNSLTTGTQSLTPSSNLLGNSGSAGTSGDFVVNGDVDLGGSASSSSIKFTGKAASALDMNGNGLSNVSSLSIGKGMSFDGSLSFSTFGSPFFPTIVAAKHFENHKYTIPDAGANAEFLLSEGNQVVNGMKTFHAPINGNLAGNATTATTAVRAGVAEAITNSWSSGASIVAALMTNGGTLSNNTTGNAVSATFAKSAAEARTAKQADELASTTGAGASIDRALRMYAKPISTDISGTATRAHTAAVADSTAIAANAAGILPTSEAGRSIEKALRTWGGTISNNTVGNASTVTNGVYTTGAYNDPMWLASVSGKKISGAVANAVSAETALRATAASIADRANAVTNLPAAGESVANALHSWGGTLSNNINGNAGTVTNGLYSTGKYSDPSWLLSLSASKLVGDVPKAAFATTAGSANPSGTAAGDLSGSYPNPQVVAVEPQAGISIVNAINRGTGTISALSLAKNLTVSGGSINSTPIGTSMPAVGSFTTSQSLNSLGASATPAPGTRYADNNIIAWGEVNADGVVKAQFGNCTIVHDATGSYTITLPTTPKEAAISITSESVGPMTFSSQRTGNAIYVHAFDLMQNAHPGDGSFYFIVVGRP